MYEEDSNSLQRHRSLESSLHRDLLNCCRRYSNEIGIISVMGILDIVKQEVVELEKATRANIERQNEVNQTENQEF